MDIDPIYPLYVDYYVSSEIWQIYEIFIWQLVMSKLGKIKTFKYLQYRYEKVPKNGVALKLMTSIFLITYIILIADDWFKNVRPGNRPFPNFIELARQLLIPLPENLRGRGQIVVGGLREPDDDDD